MSHAVRTQIAYNLSEITKLKGGYSIRFVQFTGGSGTSTGTATKGNATSHSLNVGADHLVQPTIPVNVRVAATVTETEASTTRLNFTGRGEISKIFSDGQISLRLAQGIGTGGGLTNSTTLNQSAVLTGSKAITRFINAFLHFGYSRNRSLAGSTIEIDTYQFRGGASLRLLEWLSGGVTYSYTNQDSKGSVGNTASSNSIFVGLTATADTFKFFK